MKVDLIIAGGGPTGLIAAIQSALAGLETVVIEPKVGVIDKACGEGLMPAAVMALGSLGVELTEYAPFVGVRYCDATDPTLTAQGHFSHHPGWGVRRTHLHEKLLSRAEELGVPIIQGKVRSISQHHEGVTVEGIEGRYLLAADGLHSPIRRMLDLSLPPRYPRRYGIRCHFPVAPWSDFVEVSWSPTSEAYVTPVSSQSVGVAILFQQSGRFEQLLSDFPLVCERLGPSLYEPISPSKGAGPFEQRMRRRVEGRVLFVGDASGYLDPLTGEGIALGFATSNVAIECILANKPHMYEKRWKQVTRRYYTLTSILLHISRRPWLRRTIIPVVRRMPWLFTTILSMLGGERSESGGVGSA